MKPALRRIVKRSVQQACARRPLADVICWHGQRRSRQVALTFDDGPDPTYTPRVLDLLAAKGARATFFVLGEQVVAHPELVRDMAAAGHEIGIHGWDHTDFDLPSQTERAGAVLAELGVEARLFRPPRGRWTPSLVLWMARHRYSTIMWSLDSYDCERSRRCETARQPVYAELEAGDIVLFHDDNDNCLRELPDVIALAADRGFEAACVSQVLGRP